MKNQNCLFNSFFILFGIMLLQSCMGNGTTREQQEYLDNLVDPIPTIKEDNFVNSLKDMGYFNVTLDIPIVGLVGKGSSSYIISMDCPFNLTETNKDSVIQANVDIAHELYTKVIEDSIIVEFGELNVEFTVEHSDIKKWHHILVRTYAKSTLEGWGSFKVVEDGNGKFKRVAI